MLAGKLVHYILDALGPASEPMPSSKAVLLVEITISHTNISACYAGGSTLGCLRRQEIQMSC